MEGLEKLRGMAKNEEFSKKLLDDEDFKNKFKEILKEENKVEITEEQIRKIIKNFEIILQNEKLLKEAELENIFGGKVTKSKVMKGVATILGISMGFLVGGKISKEFGGKIAEKITDKYMPNASSGHQSISETISQLVKNVGAGIGITVGVTLGGATIGATGGGYSAYKLSELICNKFGIK